MRILSVTAQRPDSTGSGIYLSELVRGFADAGHEQAVVAGICGEDEKRIRFPDGVRFCPVYYNTKELPFPVAGMSDDMPYESTRYIDMTEEMTGQFRSAFLKVINEAAETFCPDLILCHHLYLLTAIVRERFPDKKVAAVCHGSDMRQIQKNPLQRPYIKEQITKLDCIFALHNSQKQEISSLYKVPPEKIAVTGSGYNREIFCPLKQDKKRGGIRLVFAGKISEKKGVFSLIKSLSHLHYKESELSLIIAGGHGSDAEYDKVKLLSESCRYPVTFTGRLSQTELAGVFREGDVFVLPSFFEGLPLVIIEAMACGMKVVCTKLPGIKEWVDEQVPGNGIRFVEPPACLNTDEPLESELPAFERRLAETVEKAVRDDSVVCDLSNISWNSICVKITKYCR